MKAWKPFLVMAVCLGAAACRSDPNIALLERELRLQEDQIYQLRDELELAREELESCRRQLACRQTTPARSDPRGTVPAAKSEPPHLPLPEELRIETPQVHLPDESPETVPHGPATLSPAPRLPSNAPPKTGSPDQPGQTGPQLSIQGASFRQKPEILVGDSRRVARITLNHESVGGYRRGKSGSDEGVTLVIEPRDAQGRIVAAAGQVSVAVVDPALPGDTGRIARWDFSAEEAAALLTTDGPAPGLHLELPWPAEPPQHEELHLFVRYITADGRKLQTDRPLRIALTDRAPPRSLATPSDNSTASTGTSAHSPPDDGPSGGGNGPSVQKPLGPALGAPGGSSTATGVGPIAPTITPPDPAQPTSADSSARIEQESAHPSSAQRVSSPTDAAGNKASTAVQRPVWSPRR